MTTVANHFHGDSLSEGTDGAGIDEQSKIRVAVNVDEARTDYALGGIEDPRIVRDFSRSDINDPAL